MTESSPTRQRDRRGTFVVYEQDQRREWEVPVGTKCRPLGDRREPNGQCRRIIEGRTSYHALYGWDSSPKKVREIDVLLQTDRLGCYPRTNQHPVGEPYPSLDTEACLVRINNRDWLAEKPLELRSALNMSLKDLIEPFETDYGPQLVISVTCSWLTIVVAVDLHLTEDNKRYEGWFPHHNEVLRATYLQPGFLRSFEGKYFSHSRLLSWVPNWKRTYTFNVCIAVGDEGGRDIQPLTFLAGVGCGEYAGWPWHLDTPEERCFRIRRHLLKAPGTLPALDILAPLDQTILGPESLRTKQTRFSTSWNDVTMQTIMAPDQVPAFRQTVPYIPEVLATLAPGEAYPPYRPLLADDHYLDFEGNVSYMWDVWKEAIDLYVLTLPAIPQPPKLRLGGSFELNWALVRISDSYASVDRLAPLVTVLRHESLLDIMEPFGMQKNAKLLVTITAPGIIILLQFRCRETPTRGPEMLSHVDPFRRLVEVVHLATPGFLTWAFGGLLVKTSSSVRYHRQEGAVIRLLVYPSQYNGMYELGTYDPTFSPYQRAVEEESVPARSVAEDTIILNEYVGISGYL